MQEEEEQEDHQQVLEQEQEQLEDNILGTPTAGKNCGGAASFPLPHLWLIISCTYISTPLLYIV